MRIFIGVELDERTKAAAAGVVERLRRRLHRAAPDLQARWVAPANLHLTLWFIGEVAEGEAARTSAALSASPFETAAFDLELAGCGAFPPSGPPRVFWIGVRAGGDRMVDLHREVEHRLRPLGYEPERRGYTAHLTVARVKDAGRGPSRTVRDALAALPGDCGVCRIDAVTLFRSRLSPRGAAYEPLLRVPLS
jgi:2'-5' RNA ligase